MKTKVNITIDAAEIHHSGKSAPYNEKVKVLFEDGTVIYGYATSIELQHTPYYDDLMYDMQKDMYAAPIQFEPSMEVSQYDTLGVLKEAIPGLDSINATCPACNKGGLLTEVIVQLNDHHQWTRERIADWLEKSGFNQPITIEVEGTKK